MDNLKERARKEAMMKEALDCSFPQWRSWGGWHNRAAEETLDHAYERAEQQAADASDSIRNLEWAMREEQDRAREAEAERDQARRECGAYGGW